MTKPLITLALLGCTALAAQAHVVLDQTTAAAGSYYKATFRVGHGCGTSGTRQIVVQIPAGAEGAKPMTKAGWALEITRAPLAQPQQAHGRTVTDDVARISWTAKTKDDVLPDAQFDDFSILVKLPAAPGKLYWAVNQVCEQGRADWVEVPQPGQSAKELKNPAPVLEVVPNGAFAAPATAMPAGEHKH